MVHSSVFESREHVRAPPAPAAADAVEANEGAAESKPAPLRPEQKEQKAEENKTPDQPVPAEEVVRAPAKAAEPAREREEERKEAMTPAVPAGGAAARGDAVSPAKRSAPAAASPGAVRAYANSVQRALGRAKPKCTRRFTVWLKLLVSPGGGIESLEVLKSSGNRSLDAAVLVAVRNRVKLPTPPPGLAFEDLWYEFPVRCR
jgi:TonB family protein